MNPLQKVASLIVGTAVIGGAAAIFVPGSDAKDFQCMPGYDRTTGHVEMLDITICEGPEYTITARDATEQELAEHSVQLNSPVPHNGYLITVFNKQTNQFEQSLPEGWK